MGQCNKHLGTRCLTSCLFYADRACQTDFTAADSAAMEEDFVSQNKAVYELQVTVNRSRFTEEALGEDHDKVCFYMGLPSFAVLLAVFRLIEHHISHSRNNVLSKFEEMMLFLMRLRLGLSMQDLAYRFNISQATASRIC